MGILSGNPQNEPLHYGKYLTFGVIFLLHRVQIASHQVFMNHTGDEDLKSF